MADYISALTGPQMDAALEDMAQHTSEAWAVGERNGVPVVSGDDTYENSAKHWAEVSKAVSANGGEISDPNNDGHLVITTPDPSDDWAVRVDSPQTLTDEEKAQARANIAAGASNPNLLENSWFTVNQRNTWTITKTTSDANIRTYTVDRWLVTNSRLGTSVFAKNSDGTVTLDNSTNSAGYFYFVNILDENTRNAIEGKTITMSALFSDGTVLSGSATFNNGTSTIFARRSDAQLRMYSPSTTRTEFTVDVPPSTSITLKAVKLEIGAYSTLANDASPDYATELLKCQRYFVAYDNSATGSYPKVIGAGYAPGTDRFTACIALPTNIETISETSAISWSGELKFQNGVVSLTCTSMNLARSVGNQVTVEFNLSGTTTTGTTGILMLRETAKLYISAEPIS